MADNVIKRLVDAGVEFTGVSQAKAEALVRKLVRDGDVRRKDAEAAIAALAGKGKQTAEAIVVSVQREIGARIDQLVARLDDVEHRVEELVSSFVARPDVAPPATAPGADFPAAAGGNPGPAKKVGGAPTKAAAKKVGGPAKKAAAKKVAAKKVGGAPTKAAAKKAAAKKVGGAGKQAAARRSAPRGAAGDRHAGADGG